MPYAAKKKKKKKIEGRYISAAQFLINSNCQLNFHAQLFW